MQSPEYLDELRHSLDASKSAEAAYAAEKEAARKALPNCDDSNALLEYVEADEKFQKCLLRRDICEPLGLVPNQPDATSALSAAVDDARIARFAAHHAAP